MKAAASRLQVNVAPGRSAAKVKYAAVTGVVPIGCVVMVVSGAGPPGPTVNVSEDGVASTPSVVWARTRNVCVPCARPL